MDASRLLKAAREYHAAGLATMPAKRREKRPVGQWKQYRKTPPTQQDIERWFSSPSVDAVCIICGTASGNLEIIDFDAGGELASKWMTSIPAWLLNSLVVERTPSGGFHVCYRCSSPVSGNMKLAQRRKENGDVVTLIETRGEGGIFLCAPTQGYELLEGSFSKLPCIDPEYRDALLQAAWELNEYVPPVISHEPREEARSGSDDLRPGDDFNQRGDVRQTLVRYGWTCVKGGENEYWRRPGKTSSWSATLKGGAFYVHSSNASPFEPGRAYSPFSVYAMLEHAGDWERAARSLRAEGFGSERGALERDSAVDISALTDATFEEQPEQEEQAEDPGQLPIEQLRIPGFISEVMDFCMATAPYPNHVLAFCGALSLQAFLSGRKVRDPGDNRTNIYLLGLAHSSAGKDAPRKVNVRIINEAGLASAIGEKFASGEGIQDAMLATPNMLFQTDEIDGMLQTINKSKDARHESIMGTLLTLYSTSNSVYPIRRRANDRKGNETQSLVIDQPCLTLFGTAIPGHYYRALSERMLTNGFVGRMLIFDAGSRGAGQEPVIAELPARVVAAARWWASYFPGGGDLEGVHPEPETVDHTDEAKKIMVETREASEAEYSKAESAGDVIGTTVWGRVSEHARKLALIYSISEDRISPSIGWAAAKWASNIAIHQAKRLLWMAGQHSAATEFDGICLRTIGKLRDAGGQLGHSRLLKATRLDARTFDLVIDTLTMRGDIESVVGATAGRSMRAYRLRKTGRPVA